ncbi:hypothetical protein [Streptomyces sp. NPDC006971]|uniref:hypothetical protein n=1 Tax=Streptomyces sp. NPDC006971 TaxID=3154784 RepID=UPI0033C03F78
MAGFIRVIPNNSRYDSPGPAGSAPTGDVARSPRYRAIAVTPPWTASAISTSTDAARSVGCGAATGGPRPAGTGPPETGLTGGAVSLLAYGLVIWAQAHGDLATIAARRGTSILIAALIATFLFRERFGGVRPAAGAAVLVGIVVLELAHT